MMIELDDRVDILQIKYLTIDPDQYLMFVANSA